MIRPVILWTDGLIFLLLGLIIAFAIFASRRPHLAQPWRRVAQSRSGMVSLVVLLFFVAIGLLDSLHFRPQLPDAGGKPVYSVDVLSAFDVMVNTMRVHTEKTYSEPFSAYSFSRETVVLKDGTKARVYPRLRYGG
ncbi:MAG TPA: ABC transporter permease, partial [Burkholderiales bacterium]|nr:ABC transporter permease [Burkholderiales bacterium]